MEDCIFCKIVNKEIPAKILYEDEWVIAFPDIHPITPVHILIVPKKHIGSINDLTDNEENEKIAGRLIMAAREIAFNQNIAENGYKLLIRTGKDGGQEIPHIHLHLLGGGRMKECIRAIGC
ncbi:MAG: histidine triad nucleotide-binding protein [Candidatus Moranbacteria bacterium]|jgi:histidine triad (HIT) family protein|nr:histidine triad nucleotide-binding protein [Candidatus Moranbacteria bacterium]